jgi:hypothetical protein
MIKRKSQIKIWLFFFYSRLETNRPIVKRWCGNRWARGSDPALRRDRRSPDASRRSPKGRQSVRHRISASSGKLNWRRQLRALGGTGDCAAARFDSVEQNYEGRNQDRPNQKGIEQHSQPECKAKLTQ